MLAPGHTVWRLSRRLVRWRCEPRRSGCCEGNTGPYLLYAHTRAVLVLRRAGLMPDTSDNTPRISDPAERQLALTLLEFDHDFDIALEQLNPQVLCAYAYSLARSFTRFYEQCTILDNQSPATTISRLALCQIAADRLRLVLSLLGIETVDRM